VKLSGTPAARQGGLRPPYFSSAPSRGTDPARHPRPWPTAQTQPHTYTPPWASIHFTPAPWRRRSGAVRAVVVDELLKVGE